LSKALKDRSIGVWLDERELLVGDSLTRGIGDAVQSNDFMIVVLSPASVRSEWVRKELAEAMTKEIKRKRVVVLPVIYRRCEIPPFLTDKKYADFTTDSDSALQVLVRSIKRHHASNAQ
jgi:allophanate hydrolase subunit 1